MSERASEREVSRTELRELDDDNAKMAREGSWASRHYKKTELGFGCLVTTSFYYGRVGAFGEFALAASLSSLGWFT